MVLTYFLNCFYREKSKNEIGDDFSTPERIIEIHDGIGQEYVLKYTGSSVAAPTQKFRRLLKEINECDGVYIRAAGDLRKILTAHYFEYGNKRTACLTTFLYFNEQGQKPAELRPERVEHVLKTCTHMILTRLRGG